MTSIPGVDYSRGHPGGAALKAAGMLFAARYVSHTASKNISLGEATDLAAHGVWTVLVWETTANRAGAGKAAGVADAKDAAAQATAAGMPPARPIYFAVDWDASPSVVVPYFQGVASVLGLDRTGVYGGYKVVRYLLDHDLARWAWQTAAWSQGNWDVRAVIRQPATGVRINGVACDNDTAHATDYGQWMPGITPQEPDMPLTPDDIKAVATATADAIRWYKVDNPVTTDNSQTSLGGLWWDAGNNAGHAAAGVAKLLTQPAASLTDAQLTALAAKVAADPALASAIAEQVAVKLAARLQS